MTGTDILMLAYIGAPIALFVAIFGTARHNDRLDGNDFW